MNSIKNDSNTRDDNKDNKNNGMDKSSKEIQ